MSTGIFESLGFRYDAVAATAIEVDEVPSEGGVFQNIASKAFPELWVAQGIFDRLRKIGEVLTVEVLGLHQGVDVFQ